MTTQARSGRSDYEVVVVGLGAMGAATLYQLAKRGVKVIAHEDELRHRAWMETTAKAM